MSITPSIHQTSDVEPVAAQVESDLELARRAKFDPRAFEALYDRYLDRVHQYCYRRLDSREAAEDASSQIFMRALAGLPRFNTEAGTFRAWLFTIAHNVVVDQYRSARPVTTLETEPEMTDMSASPEDLALVADDCRALRLAIAQLPDRQRQVVELRLAGLSGAEIGAVLGCKTRTVDVAQFRAVASLRMLMGVTVKPKEARDA